MIADFPECDFRCRHLDTYWAGVSRGLAQAAVSRAFIVGLARDNAGRLSRTVPRIEQLGSLFADYRVFIYENDSTDNTADRLQAWAISNYRVACESQRRRDPINPPRRNLARAARMAAYRTICQQHVRLADFLADYVVVLDTDLVGGWSCDGVRHTLGEPGFDFVGSMGLRRVRLRNRRLPPGRPQYPRDWRYFDCWAHRARGHQQPHQASELNGPLPEAWQRGQPLVPVDSCFGGLGIYSRAAYLAGTYSGADCEHVTFHASLRQRGFGRLLLNPSQLVLYDQPD